MAIADPMPVLTEAEQSACHAVLAESGAQILVGSVVDMAGVARAKSVPVRRAASFHVAGMGASPTWNVFCIDNAIAFTDRLSVVGDLRLRVDLTGLRVLGDGFAWGPAEFFDQDGRPVAGCARGRLRGLQARAEAAGLGVLVGNELEFVLTDAGGEALQSRHWQAYGLGPVFDHEGFLADLCSAMETLGLVVEQLHAEYGTGQYEVSLGPVGPLEAADRVVLARLVIGRVARRHGLRASFSPLPFEGGAGNGAHQHLSFTRDGAPLLSGGPGSRGLTAQGEAALAGIVTGLPELLGVFAGSVLSASRLQPGRWSGAFACWGLENREAAVRLCAATGGNPYGANIELKCVDPSANPYLAIAAMLGLALEGMERSAVLPAEVRIDPAALQAGGAEQGADLVVRLADTQAAALDALSGSALARRILGEEIVEALLAVRRHEQHTYAQVELDELTERFRYAWSF
jgi:glutamine synthetase